MPVFVKASSRAKAYVRGSRSDLSRRGKMLGLTKARMVSGHAYGLSKKAAESYAAGGGMKALRKMHHFQAKHAKLRKLAGY